MRVCAENPAVASTNGLWNGARDISSIADAHSQQCKQAQTTGQAAEVFIGLVSLNTGYTHTIGAHVAPCRSGREHGTSLPPTGTQGTCYRCMRKLCSNSGESSTCCCLKSTGASSIQPPGIVANQASRRERQSGLRRGLFVIFQSDHICWSLIWFLSYGAGLNQVPGHGTRVHTSHPRRHTIMSGVLAIIEQRKVNVPVMGISAIN